MNEIIIINPIVLIYITEAAAPKRILKEFIKSAIKECKNVIKLDDILDEEE